VSERVCLRCDWTGEMDGAACPKCGAALYGVPEPTTPLEVTPAPRPPPHPGGHPMPISPLEAARDDESVPPAVPVAARRRWAVIVGALTVISVWIVATGGPFGRTQTPPDSGAATGPTATEQRLTADPFVGLPPEEAVPSIPETGELIGEHQHPGIGWVYVYADGRVLWSFLGPTYERRLSPAGVDLVRSGAIKPSVFLRGCLACAGPLLPAGSWAETEIRQYVPSRYALCHFELTRFRPSRFLDRLPSFAQELLRGKQQPYRGITDKIWPAVGPAQPELQARIDCWEVTTGDAGALDEVLSDAGFEEWRSAPDGVVAFVPPADLGHGTDLSFTPVLPHGEFAEAMRGPIVF
jgi:hypothetical protein